MGGGNAKKKVLVLGGTGMLGSMLVDVLLRDRNVSLTVTVRSRDLLDEGRRRLPGAEWKLFDAEASDLGGALSQLGEHDWALNAVGITKPHCHDDDPEEVRRAERINADYPAALAEHAERSRMHVLQIATDCVYSGRAGGYVESFPHDPVDAYGRSKSRGEVRSPRMHHLRCSVVGPEMKDYKFLLEWFRRQPRSAKVSGFVNHDWNGLTTYHFARIHLGIIRAGIGLGHLQHVVPKGSVTKAGLLKVFAEAYDRQDIVIDETDAPQVIDRTLATEHGDMNRRLWKAAGYAEPPDVAAMVEELAKKAALCR